MVGNLVSGREPGGDAGHRGCELPSFGIAVVSLQGAWDPALPVAASRAGATGILDLSGLSDPARGVDALRRLARLGVPERCGVLLDPADDAVANAVLESLPPDMGIWIAGRDGALLKPLTDRVRGHVASIGIVVTSAREIREAERAGADLVVVKGHESGGWIGEETSYVLAQEALAATSLPIWVWGGIGWRTAPACRIAGAAGAVLDWQLALLRESGLPAPLRERIERMDGSETAVVRMAGRARYRVLAQPGFTAYAELEACAREVGDAPEAASALTAAYRTRLSAVRWEGRAWPVGQDVCFAGSFRRSGESVGRVIPAFLRHIDQSLDRILTSNPLRPGSAMAADQGTTYPVMQGPMTRVSDVPAFCDEVERAGGLPMLALALMREPNVRPLLQETRERMGGRAWGVGILGFVDATVREEQIQVIREVLPPFAVIAGGRPDQAVELEALGIRTYLHVPSPGMLDTFVREGARRFIFEGMECGGHVGPRSSFVLWETMVERLLAAQLDAEEMQKVHVYFAGGIHDATSSLMAAAIAQPLIDQGARFGVEMGSAYLFTHEAVATGAIVPGFQTMALRADETVLFESGPGHAIRCVRNPCYDAFQQERARLVRDNVAATEMRKRLEQRHLGRLRIASKGVARDPIGDAAAGRRYRDIPEDEQHRQGMYMIGQIAAMHQAIRSMRDLHRAVCDDAGERLAVLRSQPHHVGAASRPTPEPPAPLDIAIVGMSCLLPGAEDPETFWENIIAKKDLIRGVPPDRFDVSRWFDRDPKARDKIYSCWGGFIDDVVIDPVKYGIPPASISSIEPAQLLALELVDRALRDAGTDALSGQADTYGARTSVILGVGGGMADLGAQYAMRALVPHYIEDPPDELMDQLPEWTEDSFAGILLNVVAGRASNRFNFGGVNFTVDAACASSLTAIYLACRELADGTSDRVVAGGCDTIQGPFAYLCFSKTGALSPSGKPRVFDEEADGITIGEGLAAVVLKRREDAERDGDRIYALLRSVSGGSDGRCRGMTAPHMEGQVRTLERAYDQARFSPTTVELFEAHGTGTALGDRTECRSVSEVLRRNGAAPGSHAIGSVKSMIGHTKCTAGVAGLIKSAMALYHRVLPPTLNVTTPNEEGDLTSGPLYVNTETRAWLSSGTPRRAAVSAFGFGGTNFHAVLEEYADDPIAPRERTAHTHRPAELFFFSSEARDDLLKRVRFIADALRSALDAGAQIRLADLAYTHHVRRHVPDHANHRVAVVSTGTAEFLDQLEGLAEALAADSKAAMFPRGVVYRDNDPVEIGAVAFLFPGQGSQFPGMMRQLAIEFAEVNETLSEANALLAGRYDYPLSHHIFPPPAFHREDSAEARHRLASTEIAQPAIGACSVAMVRLLESFGVRPHVCAGHSYGELTALHAAGAMSFETLLNLSWRRGQAMAQIAEMDGSTDLGAMAAVAGNRDVVEAALQGIEGVWVANVNSPLQTVISGSSEKIPLACERLKARNLSTTLIPVRGAFHSPMMAPAREAFGEALHATSFTRPGLPVFSNTLASPYPADEREIPKILLDQVVTPVRFHEEIEAIYESGIRAFIEVGPNRVLTRLVRNILGNHRHVSIATGSQTDGGLVDFLAGLGRLAAEGYPLYFDRLFQGRDCALLDLRALAATPQEPLNPHAWLVNSAYARRVGEPKRVPKPLSLATIVSSTPDATNAKPLRHAGAAEPAAAASPTPSPAAGRSRVTAGAGSPRADEVFLRAQETMRKFLETQEAVLQAYFGGVPAPRPSTEPPNLSLPPPQASPDTPRHVASEAEAPVAAPPSMDGAPLSPASIPPQADAAPLGPASSPDLESTLINIVAERTGYPPEMLEIDADMEADLGIDSIKRVEIIAAFRRAVLPEMVDPTPAFMESVSEATSMRQVTRVVRGFLDEAPSPGPEVSPAGAPVDLEAELVRIVADRTGYPPEMLELDADIEADLGIDSIKRVEIVAAFRRAVLPDMSEPTTAFTESVVSAPNMRSMVEAVRGYVRPSGAEAATHSPDPSPDSVPAAGRIPRCVVEACPIPYRGRAVLPPADGTILLTEDGTGVAQTLRQKLHEAGAQAEIVPLECLKTRSALAREIEKVRETGRPLIGAVHLSAVREVPAFTACTGQQWQDAIQTEVEGLFLLCQELAPELESTTGQRFLFAAVTAGGGDFEPGDEDALRPWRGAIAGFMKCAAREWPEARICSLDFDEVPNGEFWPALLAEWGESGPVEIGYRGGRRLGLRAVASPLPGRPPAEPDVALGPESTVLVTGGARGITAEVVKELAERTRARFILLARTPLPSESESPHTAGCDNEVDLRRAVSEQLRAEKPGVTPKEVASRVQSLIRAREIRSTLEALRAAGSEVEYVPCDVADEDAFRTALMGIRAKCGSIEAVIHGAGAIEDKYIVDKTLDSFRRVFHTKVDPLRTFVEILDPEALKLFVVFSSVAGFYGNPGQADYAAANETLNRFAASLRTMWGSKVVSLNWGPWEGTGMVTPDVADQFRTRGIELIGIDEGRRAAWEEICFGSASDVRIILGAGPWVAEASRKRPTAVR